MNAISGIVSQAARETGRLLGNKAATETASVKSNAKNAFEKILDQITGGGNGTASSAVETAKDMLAPQGLAAVEARLKALGEDQLSAGQSQALEMLTRNLARFQANHSTAAANTTSTASSIKT